MKRSIRVVLVRPRNPLNIGACARAMANFGFSDLAVVDPYEPIWRETRSAPGAEALVLKAKKFRTISEATRGIPIILGTSSFHQRPARQAVIELPEWHDFLEVQPSGRMALLLGSERSGLSNQELSACRAVLQIPTDAETPSMNLAQAAAVVLYEMALHRKETQSRPNGTRSIDREPLIQAWMDLAAATGYPPGFTSAARNGRIREATLKLQVPPEALRFLLSFTRWVHKKIVPQ